MACESVHQPLSHGRNVGKELPVTWLGVQLAVAVELHHNLLLLLRMRMLLLLLLSCTCVVLHETRERDQRGKLRPGFVAVTTIKQRAALFNQEANQHPSCSQ